MTIYEVDHLQKNDVGTYIFLNIEDENGDAVNISAAEALEMYFDKPVTGTVATHLGSVYDGPGGIMSYQLDWGDIDEPGLYEVQGYAKTSTWEGNTTKGQFFVEDTLVSKFRGYKSAYVEGT